MSNTVLNEKLGKRKKRRISREHWGYYFLIPFALAFLIFGLYPILYVLYLSFTSYDGWGSPEVIGLANYRRVVVDKVFYRALGNTLIMWIFAVIPQFALAFSMAALFSYNRVKYRGFFRAVYYLPRLVTAVSIAALFQQFLGAPFGSLNQILMGINVIDSPIRFLADIKIARGSVSFINWWIFWGNTMIMIMAGMTAISPSLYEAAKIDGASSWKIFWRITFPLLKPVSIFIFINSLLGGLQSFDVQLILSSAGGTRRGLETVVMLMQNRAFSVGDIGYASAIAFYLFLFIAIFSSFALVSRFRTEKEKKGTN